MTNALIVATFVVACATLGVALYEVRLLRGRFRREDEADLRAEIVNLYEVEGAPAGWQVLVTTRNVGGATAFNPEVCRRVSRSRGGRPTSHPQSRRGSGG